MKNPDRRIIDAFHDVIRKHEYGGRNLVKDWKLCKQLLSNNVYGEPAYFIKRNTGDSKTFCKIKVGRRLVFLKMYSSKYWAYPCWGEIGQTSFLEEVRKMKYLSEFFGTFPSFI